MKSLLTAALFPLLLALLAGCSDNNNNNRNDGGGTEEPETSLDETGIYSGTVEQDNGDVALMSLLLARDGTTAITFETDDSERASIILWGDSDGENGALTFNGRDTATDDSVAVDIRVDGDRASGRIDLANLQGDYRLSVDEYSERPSSLAILAGDYARDDNLSPLSQLIFGEDGTAQLLGECEASGSAREIDPSVNLYLLELESDCIRLNALVSLQDIEIESDVLSIAGDEENTGLAVDLFRI